jgi:hypothetical protein
MPAQPLGPTGLLAQSMTLPAGSQSMAMGGMRMQAQGMDGRKKGAGSHWLAILGNANQNRGFSISVDDAGNCIVAGSSAGSGPPVSVFRLTSGGQLLWSNTLPPTISSSIGDVSVVASPSGSATLVSGNFLSGAVGFFASISQAGDIQVQRNTDQSGNSARFLSCAVAKTGSTYAAGQLLIFSPFQCRSSVVKYTTSGSVDWVRLFEYGGGNSPQYFNGVSLDADENSYVCGVEFGLVAKLNSAGAVQFQKQITGSFNAKDVAAAPSGRFYVVGGEQSAAAVIVCFDPSGSQQWSRSLGSGVFNAVAVDASGDVYACGTQGSTLCLTKYSSSGRLLWQRTVSGGGGSEGNGVAVSGNDVYFTGKVSTNADDFLVGKVPADGSKTGAVGALRYSVSTFADAAWAYSETSSSLATTTVTPNNATPTYTPTPFALANSVGDL